MCRGCFVPLPTQVFDSVWPIKWRARCISWQRGMKVTPISKGLQRSTNRGSMQTWTDLSLPAFLGG